MHDDANLREWSSSWSSSTEQEASLEKMSFESLSKCWSGLYAANVKVTVPDLGAYYKGEGPKVFLLVDSMQRAKLSGAE